MKLGLLQCDHVQEALQPEFGDYDGMFRRWLPGDWRVYDVTKGERPADLDECDAYITTGSKASVYEDAPWVQGFAKLVRDIHAASKPFLGVCFGHQMMAYALGGVVAKSPKGWGIGIHEFRVLQNEARMQPPLETVRVLMSCQDQVEQLPPGATVLAGNEFCPVGIYRVGKMLGVQGHPEFTPEYSEALMLRRVDRIGAERVAAAQATLREGAHSAEFAKWAIAFFSPVS
jgi:GMP synthase-like glutamine amidotransferase